MSLIPFDDRDGFIWFDGGLVPWREARLHVLTHALHLASYLAAHPSSAAGHSSCGRSISNRKIERASASSSAI